MVSFILKNMGQEILMPILLTLFTSNNKSGPKTPGPQTNWDAGSGKHLEKMQRLWDVVTSTQSPPPVHPGKPPRGLHAASHRRRLRLTDRLTGVHWRTGLPVKPSLLRNWCLCSWTAAGPPALHQFPSRSTPFLPSSLFFLVVVGLFFSLFKPLFLLLFVVASFCRLQSPLSSSATLGLGLGLHWDGALVLCLAWIVVVFRFVWNFTCCAGLLLEDGRTGPRFL